MRIAIPVEDGRLCMHFGHCRQFALIDVDPSERRVTHARIVTPPPHAPGVLHEWLKGEGVDVAIAGGMGARAQALFADAGIQVITGAPPEAPDALALAYAAGTLERGENVCDH